MNFLKKNKQPKKILLIATVDYHFRAFHLPIMQRLQEQGCKVHVAAKGELDLPYCDQRFQIPFQRSPLSLENRKAYSELKKVIDAGDYDLIHCHTPVGGLLARLASRRARKKGAKIFYTAHGFHFFKGAPLQNWIQYYPVERFLARFTDCLICITREDYERAKKHRFPAGRIAHVPGVGVDTEIFRPLGKNDRTFRRYELGYQEDDLLLVYTAEFNKNKNQAMLIRALADAKEPRFRLLLVGYGPLQEYCKQLAEQLGVIDKVNFLGYRNDVKDLVPLCDIAVASSLREGLPVNVMEAMACGLPVVASANRGHRELVVKAKTGFLSNTNDHQGLAKTLCKLALQFETRTAMGERGRARIKLEYSKEHVTKILFRIYDI